MQGVFGDLATDDAGRRDSGKARRLECGDAVTPPGRPGAELGGQRIARIVR